MYLRCNYFIELIVSTLRCTAAKRLIWGQYYNNKINMLIIQYLNKITAHNGLSTLQIFWFSPLLDQNDALHCSNPPQTRPKTRAHTQSSRHRKRQRHTHLSFCLFCLIGRCNSSSSIRLLYCWIQHDNTELALDMQCIDTPSFVVEYIIRAFSMQISIKHMRVRAC